MRAARPMMAWGRAWIGVLPVLLVVGCGPPSTPAHTSGVTSAASSPPTPTPGSSLPAHGRIAFQLEFGPTGDDCNIATLEPDGTDLRMLTNVTGSGCYQDPAWTPLGDRILFDGGTGTFSHLYSIATSGGAIRQLTSASGFDGDAAMSGDGTRIAFDRSGGPNPPPPGIFVMNVDGSHVRRLTTPPASQADGDTAPSFSPDGTKLAFTRNGAIYVIGIDGKGLREVTPPGLDAVRPRWSPDGTRILFGNPDTASAAIGHNVYVVNVDGSGLHELTNETGSSVAEGPAWSPDGTMIVFDRYLDGTHYFSLVVMHSDGSDPVEIWHPTPGANNFPASAAWGTAP